MILQETIWAGKDPLYSNLTLCFLADSAIDARRVHKPETAVYTSRLPVMQLQIYYYWVNGILDG